MRTRMLNPDETAIARRVFEETLPYWRILVTDQVGGGDRPFTTTIPPFSPVALHYVLNVGDSGYGGMERSPRLRGLLIHELTHVWQGYNSLHSSGFMLNSLMHQGASEIAALLRGQRVSAYDYQAGRPWSSYNVEQQASIVEDWFEGGESEESPLFPYIRDHIRGG